MGRIIKLCQLIKPFLIQFYIAVLLQSMDQLLYRRSAELTVACDGRDQEEIAAHIARALPAGLFDPA